MYSCKTWRASDHAHTMLIKRAQHIPESWHIQDAPTGGKKLALRLAWRLQRTHNQVICRTARVYTRPQTPGSTCLGSCVGKMRYFICMLKDKVSYCAHATHYAHTRTRTATCKHTSGRACAYCNTLKSTPEFVGAFCAGNNH